MGQITWQAIREEFSACNLTIMENIRDFVVRLRGGGTPDISDAPSAHPVLHALLMGLSILLWIAGAVLLVMFLVTVVLPLALALLWGLIIVLGVLALLVIIWLYRRR